MTSRTNNPILVEITRGPIVETVFRGAAAVVAANGDIKFSIGSISDLTYPRSSVKSVQAVPLVESGAAEAFGLSDAELAVTCASHGGDDLHVDLVRSILNKAGLPESTLKCGTHWPLGRESGRALLQSGQPATVLHNNCSGKHVGMLSACLHMGLPLEHYTEASHPLQMRVAEMMAELSGDKVSSAVYGIDGCSLPNWPLTVRGMAQLFARIATGADLETGTARAFRKLIEAGFRVPEAMGGKGRMPTEILSSFPGKIYVKEGAEGVYCGALLPLGLGVAVKIEDGGRKASEIVIANILSAYVSAVGEGLGALERYMSVILRTWTGTDIGKIAPSKEFRDVLSNL